MSDGRGFARVATQVFNVVAVVTLIGLSWAAVHDVLKGEKDITGEVTLLIFTVFLFASVLMGRWMRSRSEPR